jgi:hypothetical protein
MAIKMTPEEFQEKHARRLKGAIEDMRSGIEKVDVAPTKLAGDKEAKMKAKLLARIEDGTWKRRVQAVTLEDWKSKMIDKGLNRVSSGIDSAAAKVKDFASQLIPAVSSAQTKISGMPDLTLEDSINRMNTFVREMAKFRKR